MVAGYPAERTLIQSGSRLGQEGQIVQSWFNLRDFLL